MKFKKVFVDCFDSTCTGKGFHLFIEIERLESVGKYVTYICDHHQYRYLPSNSTDHVWWTEEMVLFLFDSIERGVPYSEITSSMNSKFGTSFSGVQRSNGKGFRGDVTRKVYRTSKVDWSDSFSDDVLILIASQAYSKNNLRSATEHSGGTQ